MRYAKAVTFTAAFIIIALSYHRQRIHMHSYAQAYRTHSYYSAFICTRMYSAFICTRMLSHSREARALLRGLGGVRLTLDRGRVRHWLGQRQWRYWRRQCRQRLGLHRFGDRHRQRERDFERDVLEGGAVVTDHVDLEGELELLACLHADLEDHLPEQVECTMEDEVGPDRAESRAAESVEVQGASACEGED